MRISASGLASTTLVAIDQIFRLAPSSNPPIEPVVSRTNATSTVGLALACDIAAEIGNATIASATARMVMTDFMFPLQGLLPAEPRVPVLRDAAAPELWRAAYKFGAEGVWMLC